MSEMIVRRATIKDAEMLADLSRQTFYDAFHAHPKNAPEDLASYMAEAFSLEQTRRELSEADSVFLVAEVEDETAGYAKIIFGSREEGITATKSVELNRLYSHQKFLGRGIGQALMDECLTIARENNCDVMWLGVWEFNPRAQAFYRRYGFREVGRHIFQLGSDPQIDLLMELNI